jgi:hypothetical protein
MEKFEECGVSSYLKASSGWHTVVAQVVEYLPNKHEAYHQKKSLQEFSSESGRS